MVTILSGLVALMFLDHVRIQVVRRVQEQLNFEVLKAFEHPLKIMLCSESQWKILSNMAQNGVNFFSNSLKISRIGPFGTCDPSFDMECLRGQNYYYGKNQRSQERTYENSHITYC